MDIFVAKLSSETTAENLTELFSGYGTVSLSKVIMDRTTGMSKCYGFVEMKNDTEGANAIEQLNDSKFMGKYILVKKSEPRPVERHPYKKPPQIENRYENKTLNNEKSFNSYD